MNEPQDEFTRRRGGAELSILFSVPPADYCELRDSFFDEMDEFYDRRSASPRLRVKPFLKWTGTALQLGGCLVLALHVPLSPYAYGAMTMGAGIWLALSLAARDWPQAALMAGFEITNLIGIWRWGIG